ncbi:MAG: arsenate reductase ArsC [Candidatus Omnitrophica bacterium]|jgi:arsenate reductase|nr:arsenate reductase ArsC [Candidatus Omnitrophota bacterium]
MNDNKKLKVLFLCTHNSARSQMAEGLLKNLYPDYFQVQSAGSHPGQVNPDAIKAMAQIGINISEQRSKSLKEFLDKEFDYIITVCDQANQTCPVFPGKAKRIHWPLKDPANIKGSSEEVFSAFCQTRDKLKILITEFAKKSCLLNSDSLYKR